ncbi:MAG: hypothetical protein ABI321_13600 [Polyangia bacterium]
MRAALVFALLCGCGGGASVVDAGRVDAGRADAAVFTDAATLAGDGGTGAVCTFNSDCVAAARCECSEAAGCACQTGVRGTGRNGVDTCTDGNDCASALCVEGPGSVYYCSDACSSDTGCTGMLPRCLDVTFLGQICARSPM